MAGNDIVLTLCDIAVAAGLLLSYECWYTRRYSRSIVLYCVDKLGLLLCQDGMMDYFNNQMRLAGLAGPDGDPIISCQVNLDKNFAFLEVCDFLL